MTRNKLSLILVSQSYLFLLLSCNNADFKGDGAPDNRLPADGVSKTLNSDDSIPPPIAPTNTAEEAIADAPPPATPTSLTPGEVTIEHSMRAYEKFSYDLTQDFKNHRETSELTFDQHLDNDIIGLKFNRENRTIDFQADLQDIGKELHSELQLATQDETNNISVSLKIESPEIKTHDCFRQPAPVIGDLAPVEKWHWSGWTDPQTQIRYYITYSSPVAADLDGDGKVEVVVIASSSDYMTNGKRPDSSSLPFNDDISPVFVLDGETGSLLWNSFELNDKYGKKIGALSSTTPSLGDLNKDGSAEIVVVSDEGAAASKNVINILNYKTKSLVTRYAPADNSFVCATNCQPAIGDLDGDGEFEIVAGNAVLNHAGELKFNLTSPSNTVKDQRNSLIIDIFPSSPGAEIIVGNMIFSATGQLLWQTPEFSRGFVAAADIQHDGNLELILVGTAQIDSSSLWDGHVGVFGFNEDKTFGKLLWKKQLPRVLPRVSDCSANRKTCAQHGGAPNVGNFDADADFEIGLAGGDYYVVYDTDGSEKWKAPTTDWSSHQTGSSIFDLNGDGSVEVLYNDEKLLRIYNGTTGEELWSTENKSGTLWEYPLVLNIDNDASVEIVVSAPGSGGVRVFEDPSSKWVSSRKLWSQYAYFPEYISDTLQAVAAPAELKSGFRVNSQGTLTKPNKIMLPDLQVFSPLYFNDKNPAQPEENKTLHFLIANLGQADYNDERGIFLEIFDIEGNILVTSQEAKSLIKSGEFITMDVSDSYFNNITETEFQIILNLNTDRTFAEECNLENNKGNMKLFSPARRNEAMP